jgi:hypothetical protein
VARCGPTPRRYFTESLNEVVMDGEEGMIHGVACFVFS